jgi:hypothetical protein
MKRWADIKNKGFSRERSARLAREVAAESTAINIAITLSQLRELAGATQVDLAELAKMTQAELSRFERRDDRRLSTLRRYIEALGGDVEITATFGKKRLVLDV